MAELVSDYNDLISYPKIFSSEDAMGRPGAVGDSQREEKTEFFNSIYGLSKTMHL